jgi:hypothetical protein
MTARPRTNRRVERQRGVDLAARGGLEGAEVRLLAVDRERGGPLALDRVPEHAAEARRCACARVDPELPAARVAPRLA